MTDHHHAAGEQVQRKVSNSAFLDAEAPADNAAFLRAVFGDAWAGIPVCAFTGDPAQADRRDWVTRPAAKMVQRLTPGANNYYCISAFDDDYGSSARGIAPRRKALFVTGHLLVVDDVAPNDDLGSGRKVRASFVRARTGEPTFRIETSPGNEQWGYVFRVPVADRHVIEALQDGMIAQGLTSDGTDPGMRGVTRLVRLPYGTNGKARYRTPTIPEGFPTRLTAWNPGRLFTLDDIAAAFCIDLGREVERRRAAERIMLPADSMPEGMSALWSMEWAQILPPTDHVHAAQFRASELMVLRGGPNDPLLAGLRRLGMLTTRAGRSGVVQIRCPFENEHSGQDRSGAAWMPRHGTIHCFHGHCAGRPRHEYDAEVAKRLRRTNAPDAIQIADVLDPPNRARPASTWTTRPEPTPGRSRGAIDMRTSQRGPVRTTRGAWRPRP